MRPGRFFLADSVLLGQPELCLEIQSRVLITEAVTRDGYTAYVGLCEDWDEAPLEAPPVYNVIVTVHPDGAMTWEWKREQPLGVRFLIPEKLDVDASGS